MSKWLVADYYENFRCKCEKCRHSCCHGWQIPVSKDEYLELINQECDEELRHRLDVSFITPEYIDENRYRVISFNYLGDCPMNKDGLCEVHKKLGETYLPKTCRLYPRSLKNINGINTACCSSSCEAVIEALLNENKLSIKEIEMDAVPSFSYTVDSDIKEELNDFEIIMENDNRSIVERISDICLSVNSDEFNKDFNSKLNPLLEAMYLLDRLAQDENLKDICEEIKARYSDNYGQFKKDREAFERNFPLWQIYFRNCLANSLLFESFPFVDRRFDKTKAYKGLCASYGLLRLVCIGYMATRSSKDDLVDCISILFHLIDHTSFYYNANVLTKAAALLLKI